MLGFNAKIDGARAKRRPASCSVGLSAQHLRLPNGRSPREKHDALSGPDFSHAAEAGKSKRLQPLRFVLLPTQAHTTAQYLQLLRHANPSLDRRSRACLPAKTGQLSATGASKNVSVRIDLGLLFSSTYRFFNCTLVSVRARVCRANRYKMHSFQSAFQTLKSGDWRPKETARAAR
jgi:hypothetical protein